MHVHKFLYVMVYLVTPLTYFTVSILWSNFILEKSMWTNLSDNLSIMGIYYFFVSIFWLMNMKTIDRVTEKIENNKTK
ncbi:MULTISPECIES: hypothetical protein [Bacillus]|uniref:Group-specific protein n=1 Tax=Bacillus cereus TaxID=1396 RepID=A0A150BNL1_BACCE|nr:MULTISPECIES: hypothetical protein [Bacillus cereus group]EJR48095.1 hypothetical protein IIO_06666 [Bacillus cereus VD115]AZR80789.1 hypothetical protein BtSCAC15_32365 [Bacillus thuringiensis]AZR80793.1 hypothetical protein BtSCAC15_32395 [Bacillus thuringiensis]KXY27540.1 hypothetical protein AT267_04255 [Bacillus cereus]MCQ6289049.1 hypothetical protein [Bacillus cereus]